MTIYQQHTSCIYKSCVMHRGGVRVGNEATAPTPNKIRQGPTPKVAAPEQFYITTQNSTYVCR